MPATAPTIWPISATKCPRGTTATVSMPAACTRRCRACRPRNPRRKRAACSGWARKSPPPCAMAPWPTASRCAMRLPASSARAAACSINPGAVRCRLRRCSNRPVSCCTRCPASPPSIPRCNACARASAWIAMARRARMKSPTRMPASAAATARCSTPCPRRSRKTCCASRTRSTCTCAPVARMPWPCSRRPRRLAACPTRSACSAWAWRAMWSPNSATCCPASPAAAAR